MCGGDFRWLVPWILIVACGCVPRTAVPVDGGFDSAAADLRTDSLGVDGPMDDSAPNDGPSDGGGTWCRSWIPFDCPAPQDCDTRSCSPGALGQCVALVLTCPDTLDPVCGCNGTTYTNDCYRIRDHVGLKQAGPCQPLANDGGACLDWDLEPNDTPATATSLDAALFGHPGGVSLYGLEVCSSGDVDYYSFTLTDTKDLALYVQYARVDGDLTCAILDSGLTEIAVGMTGAGGLEAQALIGPGTTYLRVAAGAGGTTNRYDFSLTLQ